MSRPCDELGPLARNWEDIRERARKAFGITPEESARRAALRRAYVPGSYDVPQPSAAGTQTTTCCSIASLASLTTNDAPQEPQDSSPEPNPQNPNSLTETPSAAIPAEPDPSALSQLNPQSGADHLPKRNCARDSQTCTPKKVHSAPEPCSLNLLDILKAVTPACTPARTKNENENKTRSGARGGS